MSYGASIIDLQELISSMTQPNRLSTDPPAPDAEVHLILPEGAAVSFLAEKNTVIVRWGEAERAHRGSWS